MITKTKMAFLALMLACCFVWAQGPSGQAKTAEPLKTTADDRQSVEVTIYSRGNGTGLVKERRKVRLPAGRGELQFMDVASEINPVTVRVKPLSDAGDFVILEQNYEYDLISPEKLMDKYVGKDIKIIERNKHHDTRRVVEATLLSTNKGNVYRIDNEIYLGHPGTKVLPEIPGNLISRPTLSWTFRNRVAREYELEASYLTGGMNWNADYVLFIDESKEGASGLSGWVTLDNRSGASYDDAKVTLVAGSTRDGLIYDLDGPTTIKNRQKKQVSLMEAHGLKVEKEYVVSSLGESIWRRKVDGASKQTVNAFFKFKNSKENKLGAPLPAGIMRMYTADAGGSQQLIGEDRVAHVPVDEDVRLKVGEVFDLVAERTQLDYKLLTSKSSEIEWMIALRNRKSSEDVIIRVKENAFGDWEIRQSSHKHTKVDAKTFQFDVPVAKGQEVIVKYKVRTSW